MVRTNNRVSIFSLSRREEPKFLRARHHQHNILVIIEMHWIFLLTDTEPQLNMLQCEQLVESELGKISTKQAKLSCSTAPLFLEETQKRVRMEIFRGVRC